jgi:hydroxymethylglutaryl-CoA synthase
MAGLTHYATYVPQYRLAADEVARSIGQSAKGARTVAGFDQDTTTLGVEAALPLATAARRDAASLWFATTAPVYADKANATTIHAALRLRDAIAAIDLGVNLRSGPLALLSAHRDGGLAVLSDTRGGAVGGTDERTGGDAAAAFLFGDNNVLAEVVASASASAEFLDRWRSPGESAVQTWEERFGEGRYLELLDVVVAQLREKGVDLAQVDTFAVVSANARAAKAATGRLAAATGGASQDLQALAHIGQAGAAQAGLALAQMLDSAAADQVLLLVSLADGGDALVLRTTPALDDYPRPQVAGAVDQVDITYSQYLVWRGRVEADGPRRPEPERPSAPFAWRNRDYKLALRGGRCDHCHAVQYPTPSVCYRCHRHDTFTPVDATTQGATVITATVDRLAFSPNPPLVSAVVRFDEGGRMQCELTDVRTPPAIGDRVVPTFRRGATVHGIHNYIWKARPVAPPAAGKETNNGPAQPE